MNAFIKGGCEAHCPGCAHRLLSKEESLQQKTNWLQSKLSVWQDVLGDVISVKDAKRWNYRDKVCLSVQWQKHAWQFGLIHRDTLVPIPNCPVHSPRVRAVIKVLSRSLPPAEKFPLKYYVQSGAQTTLVLKTSSEPNLDWLRDTIVEDLMAAGVEGLWLHLYPAVGRRIFHKNRWILLWGQEQSYDGFGLVHGPTAFQQLIPDLYHQALDTATAALNPTRGDYVLDLYCGIGHSLRRWYANNANAIGVEISGEAVACARDNVPLVETLRGKCEHRIPQIRGWLGDSQRGRRLLYANPPRTGIEPKVLSWVSEDCQPERIVYLSCSAGTLQRDLLCFTNSGYALIRLQPYDFFPQTQHVETLAFLQRNKH
jgi:23S rRNA (uracil1939-C5)-methyltransferase